MRDGLIPTATIECQNEWLEDAQVKRLKRSNSFQVFQVANLIRKRSLNILSKGLYVFGPICELARHADI